MQNITEPAAVGIDGAQVRRLRKVLGENLAPFAARCDISEGYLSHIELGRRKTVTPRVFGAICDALGLQAAEDRRTLMTSVERGGAA